MRRTWPRLPIRTTPASGWSPARTRSWKPSGPANANHCSPPPKLTWRKSPPLPSGNAARCAARARSRCAPTGCCAAARSPSTSGPRSLTTASATPATRSPSPPKPPWTASTCCAPASNPAASTAARWSPLQGARPGRAGVPGLQYRPGHPPDPPPHRDPGPRARVLADAVVLHHLAHARPPRAAAVHRRRQASRPGRPNQPRRPGRPLPAGTGQGRGQAHRRGLPVHSFTSLLADLATICLNQIQPADPALPASARHHAHPPARRPSTCSASPPPRRVVRSRPTTQNPR